MWLASAKGQKRYEQKSPARRHRDASQPAFNKAAVLSVSRERQRVLPKRRDCASARYHARQRSGVLLAARLPPDRDADIAIRSAVSVVPPSTGIVLVQTSSGRDLVSREVVEIHRDLECVVAV
jgi:hypothetical protein